MTDLSHDSLIEETRRSGARLILPTMLVLACIGPAVAAFRGGPTLAFAISAAAIFGIAAAVARRPSALGRHMLGIGLMGEIMLITAALAGHGWQLDSHMLYFAAIAMLIALADPLVLLSAAAVVALQHLLLGVALPGLVYPSADLATNLLRTSLHGALVVLEVAVLFRTVQVRLRQMQQAAEQAEENRAVAVAANARADEIARQDRDQSMVVDRLREALGRIAGRDLTAEISEPFPALRGSAAKLQRRRPQPERGARRRVGGQPLDPRRHDRDREYRARPRRPDRAAGPEPCRGDRNLRLRQPGDRPVGRRYRGRGRARDGDEPPGRGQHAGTRGREPGDGTDRLGLAPDLVDHQRDRGHRRADQPARAQCWGRGGPGR